MKTVFTAQHSIDPRQSPAYVDKNHDGDIKRKDFVNATRELGYDATDDEFEDLLRCFALLSKLRQDKLHRVLHKAAAQGGIDAKQSLQHSDKDGSGEVDRAEFDEAMKEPGFTAKSCPCTPGSSPTSTRTATTPTATRSRALRADQGRRRLHQLQGVRSLRADQGRGRRRRQRRRR